MKIFDYEGKVMSFLGDMVDLIELNLLCLIFSIPIVTRGAALSAKYCVSMKMVRKEAPLIFKPFVKAFVDNFKQATIIWLTQLVPITVLVIDWIAVINKGWGSVSIVFRILIILASIEVIFINITIYPLIARFEMSILHAYKGAFIISIFKGVYLLAPVIIWGLVVLLSYMYPALSAALVLVGTTLALYLHTFDLVKVFEQFEPKEEDGKNMSESEQE